MNDSLTLWGLTPSELHDRFWLSCGVQVVRRTSGARLTHGTTHGTTPGTTPVATYLLLDEYELAIVDAPDALPDVLPDRDGAVRIMLTTSSGRGYCEHVIADENDRVLGIHRSYSAATENTGELLFTRDIDVAKQWASCESFDRYRLSQRCAVRTAAGRVFTASSRASEIACVNALQQVWQHPEAHCPDVYELEPGVCIHATTIAAGGVQFVSPVWIGAEVTLEQDDLIVGPWTAADHSSLDDDTFAGQLHLHNDSETVSTGASPGLVGKRVFDVAFSLMALAITLPLFPIIMLLIWIEDGRPFFFAHHRQTQGGREFTCYKFRTMCRNAESMKQSLAERNACDGPQFHLRDDPRLLRIGRWLRCFHLDELPQFFNVLLGHMHVVGPRPSPDRENQFCPAWRERRLSVKPGITGLWQVQRTRAPQRDFQEWIQYDLEYVARQNWRLDLWILYRTVHCMLIR